MSVRFRLVMSYLVMILVPIIFVVISALLVALLFKGDIKELKNIYLPPEHQHELSKSDAFYINIHRETLINPSEFSNEAYLKQIDSQLSKNGGTELIVRKGKNIIYQSASLKSLDKDELPMF